MTSSASPAAAGCPRDPGPVRRTSTRITIGRDVAVRVVEDPFASVLAAACAGVRDRAAGRSSPFARAVRALRTESLAALARVVVPGASLSPDCLTPTVDVGGDPDAAGPAMAAHLDRLRSLRGAEIEADLHATFGGALPPHWASLGTGHRDWARHVADGLEAMWSVVGDEWHRQRCLRDGEAERIGLAAVTGSLDVALAAAHPRGRGVDSGFEFPDPDGVDSEIGDRTVVLNPLLAGLHLTVANLDRRTSVYFAYPARPAAGPSPDGESELHALLTAPRAALLGLAAAGRVMSQLARATHLTPASVTHHVDWLERCGLVRRHRRGRTVWVHATRRGLKLTELYAARR